MRNKVYQNLGCIENMHEAYQADSVYTIDDITKIFKNNLENRKDLDETFKQKLLNTSIDNNYEVVYYPAHIYQTTTTKTWTTTKTSKSYGIYVDKTTKTTTSHTQSGYQKLSEAKFKSRCNKLSVDKIDLENISKITNYSNLSIQMYKKGLFFDRKENSNNAVEIGREASKAKSGDSTHTNWTLHIVFIPIFRYDFEYNDKTYYFEMNLHNGTFITHYKQKCRCAFAKTTLRIIHILLSLALFLVPLIILILGFKSGFIVDSGIIEKLLGIIVPGICILIGASICYYYIFTAREEFEKLFYDTFEQFLKIFTVPIIALVIIIVLTLVFKEMAFN